jgi:hypothetical protein
MSVYVSDRFVPVRESRVQAERTGDGLRIAVPPRRSLWQFLYLGWALFVVGGGLVLMVSGDEQPSVPFMIVWVAFGLAIVGASVWGLLSRIEHLRVSPESRSPFDLRAGLRMYGIGGGTIAFDYGARTVRVANADEAEARRIVEALASEGVGR